MSASNDKNHIVLIGLVGFIGAGKGTVGDILRRHFDFQSESFAAPLKDACASIFGWPRDLLEGDSPQSREFRETVDLFWSQKLAKSQFTPRQALQQLGTDVMREHFDSDIWVNSLEYRIRREHQGKNILLTDARFANELAMIRRVNGVIIRVKRGPDPQWMELAAKANQGDLGAIDLMDTLHGDVHASEWGWVGGDVDYVIDNHGDLAELERQVLAVVDRLPQKALIYTNQQRS